MVSLEQFKKDIESELTLSILEKGKTPILDRLQIHLDNLGEDYNLSTMLNPKNLDVELYLSMLYQIVYPAKKIQKFSIEVDGQLLKEEKNPKQTGVALLRELGIGILKQHPKYGKYVFKSKEEFYSKYSNNVTLLEIDGFYVSVLHILYSSGKNTLDKITNFIVNINEHLQYQKIKINDNSYYQL
tara:strand:+ start:201 stop:755 length:555 start_codon:yes stop_codon:yes gene_type:complete